MLYSNGVFFFECLNQCGRGNFLGQSSIPKINEWVDKIAFHNDDLSAIFYYLRLNPALIDPVQVEESAKRKRKAEALALFQLTTANLDSIANFVEEYGQELKPEDCVAVAVSMQRVQAKFAKLEF